MTNNESPLILVSILNKNAPGGMMDLSSRVLSFSFEDGDTKADKCSLTVRNDDWLNFDTRVWHQGAQLRIQWGYYQNMSAPRLMVIQGSAGGKKKGGKAKKAEPAIKGSTELTIDCYDLSVLMNKRKEVKTYKNKTRGDVAKLIAEAWGYGADRQFITQTGVVKPTITQAALTDGELLTKLAKEEGFKFYVDFDGFHFHAREFDQVPKRVWSWAAARNNREAVLEVNIDNDATLLRPKGIRVRGIDKMTGKPFDVTASNTETERSGLAATLEGGEDVASKMLTDDDFLDPVEIPEANNDNTIELIDPRDKSSSLGLLQAAIELIDPRDKSSSLGLLQAAIEAPIVVLNDGAAGNAEEAKAKADAKYRELVACSVKLNLTVLGDPSFGAKQVFFFECPSRRITGRYYAKKVVHSVAAGEYTMTIESITDGGNDGKGKKSAAKVNKEDPPATASSETDAELEEVEVIDPRDKSSSTWYREKR